MSDKPKKSDIRAFHNRVLRASAATHATRGVLRTLLWYSDWKSGGRTVVMSRQQIEKETGYSRSAVFEALRFLKEEGALRIYYNELGGRGNAAHYQISVPEKVVNNQTKGVTIQTKVVTKEPPIHESIYPEEKRSAASRSGGTIKREDGDAVNTYARGRPENEGAGGYRPRNPENLHPAEIAEIVTWSRHIVVIHCEALHDTNQNERANAVWAAWQEANPDE